MSTNHDPDGIVVRDRASRRRFIRTGAAFLVSGAALGTARTAFADCDRYGVQQQRSCSDSDSGENADPDGCGRCGRPESVPSGIRREPESSELMVEVARVRASGRG